MAGMILLEKLNGIISVDHDSRTGHNQELNKYLDFTYSINDIIWVPLQAGIIIHDVSKNLSINDTSPQCIMLPISNRTIPILYNSSIPYFDARYPTDSDMENYEWFN